MEIIVPKLRLVEVKIDKDKGRVIILEEGKVVLDVPWNMALSIGRSLIKQAKIVEEHVKAPEIIKGQALLQRVGFPIGLTNNPDIQKEAMKEAVNSKELRKAFPGGIKSQSAVGVPSVIKKPPKEEN